MEEKTIIKENKELKRQLGCYIADQEILLTAPKAIFKKLMNLDEFLLHANEHGQMFYVDFVVWLNEIAKELGIEIGEIK